LESLCQLLKTATQIKDRVDNDPSGFGHIEDPEGISRDQQPAISTSIKAPAQGESRKLLGPGLYVVKEGLFFPVSMFSNPIVGLFQVLFRSWVAISEGLRIDRLAGDNNAAPITRAGFSGSTARSDARRQRLSFPSAKKSRSTPSEILVPFTRNLRPHRR
jgi:hypothetical protein